MNNYSSSIRNNKYYYLIIIFLFVLLPYRLYSQADSEYHFVYIDISKTKELSNLQAYLDNLYKQIKDQKYVFFLSNRNEPKVATNQKSFNKLLASISNISPSAPNLNTDIEQINRVMSENDFLSYDESQQSNKRLNTKYKLIAMHFFLDPGSYNTLNMKKYLIDYLCDINYANVGNMKINVIVYFDITALKVVQNLNFDEFNNNDYKLIKY